MNKKLVLVLATLLAASVAFAQIPSGQGPTVLNGGILSTPGGFTGFGPNNQGGPGLGRHGLQDAETHLPIGCESCHLPHTTQTYGKSFLWAWRIAPTYVTTYVTATNPSGALVTPTARTGNARSMLCFSCHDGTSASANGITAAITLNGVPFPVLTTVGGTGAWAVSIRWMRYSPPPAITCSQPFLARSGCMGPPPPLASMLCRFGTQRITSSVVRAMTCTTTTRPITAHSVVSRSCG